MAVKTSHLIKWWEIWWHQIHSSALRWLVTSVFPPCCSKPCPCISVPDCFLSGSLEASDGRVFMLGESDCKPNQTSGEQWSEVLSSVKIVGIVSSWHSLLFQPGKAVRPGAPGRVGEILDIRPWAFLKEEKMLLQWALTLCSGFSFSWMIAVDGRGWRGFSLHIWSRCRFCIFSVSVLHLINKKQFSGGVNLGCKWEST